MNIARTTTAAACGAVVLTVLCVLAATAQGGFTASVKNSTNLTGSGTMFLTATNGSPQCTSVPTGASIPATSFFPCTGNQFPATVPATGTATAGEVLTAAGTASFKSASYTGLACGPVQLANTAEATDPLLVRGGVAFDEDGPPAVTGLGALGVDGSTALAANVTSSPGLQTFSMGVWFKSSTASGGLMGFSASPSDVTSKTSDRHLYFNAAGNILFGVSPGSVQTIQSPDSYADGAWHYAVGTLASGPLTSTQTLYIDGAQVATDTFLSLSGDGAAVYNGYWRLGQTRTAMDGWGGRGQYLAGSLSGATIFPTALTPAKISALYTAGTKSALATLATANGATSFWPLSDTGLQSYSGPYPGGAGNPCAHVLVTVGTAGKCVYPSIAGPCPALASTYLLTGLVAAGTVPLSPSTPAQPHTLTTTLSRGDSYNTDYDVGLHLLVPISVTESGFPQTFTWPANAVII